MFRRSIQGPAARVHHCFVPLQAVACAAALALASACSNGTSASTSPDGPVASASGLTVTSGGTAEMSGPLGGPFPTDSSSYLLRNIGAANLDWTARASENWLVFSNTSGTLAPGASELVTVVIDQVSAAQLVVGDWPANITLVDTSGATGTIQLGFILHVLDAVPGPGELTLTPETEFVATGSVGGPVAPESATYTIGNAGDSPLSWAASVTQPWISVAPATSGALAAGESLALAVTLDQGQLAGLGAGTHSGYLVVDDVDHGDRVAVGVRVVLSDPPGGNVRVTDGLVVLYDFTDGTGTTVRDRSGMTPALDLTIEDAAAINWLPGALQFEQGTLVRSSGPATKILDAVDASNELTVETWIRPRDLQQDGPARIVTLSDGTYLRNLTLGQGLWGSQPRDTFNCRLRTTTTDNDGVPLLTTGAGSAHTGLQHLVYTFATNGQARIYIDGDQVASDSIGGTLSSWSSGYALGLGNEFGANRPWFGEMHLVAMYDRALSAAEIDQNFEAGSGAPAFGQLAVTPASGYSSSGPAGGDAFQPDSKTYTLSNPGDEAIDWSVTVSEPWLSVGQENGRLDPGESTLVVIELVDGPANALPIGAHNGLITLRNDTNGFGSTARNATLSAQDPNNGGGYGPRPDATNTGPTNPSALTSVGSMTVTTDGALIENVRVGGTLRIKANNVTVRNFIVDGGGGSSYGIRATDGYQGIVIEDGEVKNVVSSCIYGGGFTARRLNVHESGGDGFKTTGNVLVEHCWIHHLGTNPGAHADGNQTRYGSNFVFRANNFDMPITVPGPYKSNAALIIQTGEGPIDNVLIEGNWVNGGNFTVYLKDKGVGYGDPTNCTLLNNRFGLDYRFGVLSTTGPVHIEGNVWDGTGELMDINNH
ncbi:MAG: hypothetical protein GY711_26290 [bacterium]|nr:hypothetical protein [bacterium]